jgi:hypothetical protein
MQRRGKTAAGSQRWLCISCNQSSVRNRPDTTKYYRQKLFVEWVTGTKTLTDFALRRGIERRTLERWFTPFWLDPPKPILPSSLEGQVLILDATSLKAREWIVLIARTPHSVVSWLFAPRENYESWLNLLLKIPQPAVIVCDGQRGMLAVAKRLWPDVRIQRCLIHVKRQAEAWLTQHPRAEAGLQLQPILRELTRVRTRRQKRRWIRQLKAWCKRHDAFLKERTVNPYPDGQRKWWYTHRKLRGVRSLIVNSLPYLFTFIGHPEIPRTTNHVEGGINARIKELRHRHRGLKLNQLELLVGHFLKTKQLQKPPRNVT